MCTLAELITGKQARRGAEVDHAGITQTASKIPRTKRDSNKTKEKVHKRQ